MSGTIIGLVFSGFCVFGLMALFWYEERKGMRFADQARLRFDYVVVTVSVYCKNTLRFVSKDFLQQTFHYLLHTILKYSALGIGKIEQGIRKMMHVNKTIAKKAERESTTRSKLDEVALHKVATALTEEQKRVRKEKSLLGK
jgi:hypothetical protein